ncbi:CGNR zinc finger domain-containing protein [Longimicrobium sp.]|uniref:CGNR zinc finger domain-containing protein n=1 Tax=Longimicrobium sp. TaxID=2029185 RepID=UPI002CD90468|nr:ABATE domain-containing protein [Longimicrobium sp.]HSU15481.1 ABATE domain-containing protein [Longimicrobium sp.]
MDGINPFAEKELAGGHLALDFANTLGQHEPEPLSEWLHGYDDLVWWGLRAGVVTKPEAEALFAAARARPGDAEKTFERAIAFREALFRVFSSLGAGGIAPPAEVERMNAELAAAGAHLCVAPEGEGFGWGWRGEGLDRVLWPVAKAAAELLVSGELGRIGECAGDECQWLYIDTSRNHSRRWCVMSDCGNRAKARRHYHRVRTAADAG